MPPIYTLTFYNAIANGGAMVKPLFVKNIKRNGEIVKTYETEVLKSAICKPTTLKDVQEIMLGVLEGKYGTAKRVRSNIVRIAGKTGTAQISQGSLGYKAGQTKHNVSFCGYFPADNPEYTCIVVLTAPNGLPSGGGMAGSIFKKVAERIVLLKSSWTPEKMASDTIRHYAYLPEIKNGNSGALKTVVNELTIPMENPGMNGWIKQKESDGLKLSLDTYKIHKGLVPDVSGMGAKDAFYLLGNLGIKVKLNGRGKVVAQSLHPGTKIQNGAVINLELK
jgi:cell division protein FtsI (penicillin-binding protein 3)